MECTSTPVALAAEADDAMQLPVQESLDEREIEKGSIGVEEVEEEHQS